MKNKNIFNLLRSGWSGHVCLKTWTAPHLLTPKKMQTFWEICLVTSFHRSIPSWNPSRKRVKTTSKPKTQRFWNKKKWSTQTKWAQTPRVYNFMCFSFNHIHIDVVYAWKWKIQSNNITISNICIFWTIGPKAFKLPVGFTRPVLMAIPAQEFATMTLLQQERWVLVRWRLQGKAHCATSFLVFLFAQRFLSKQLG